MAGAGDVVVNRRDGLRPFKSGAPFKSVLSPDSSLLLVSIHQMLLLVQVQFFNFQPLSVLGQVKLFLSLGLMAFMVLPSCRRN